MKTNKQTNMRRFYSQSCEFGSFWERSRKYPGIFFPSVARLNDELGQQHSYNNNNNKRGGAGEARWAHNPGRRIETFTRYFLCLRALLLGAFPSMGQ